MNPEWQAFLLVLAIGTVLALAALLSGDIFPEFREWLFKADPDEPR